MRPVYVSDLHYAACVLRQSPAQDRAQLATIIVMMADTADRYRKRLGRAHPAYGLGTLTSAAQKKGPATPPQFCDAGYLDSLRILVTALQNHHHHIM